MVLPIELLAILACVGVFFIAGLLLWAGPHMWYRVKNKRFKPTHEELELQHVRQMHTLKNESMQTALDTEKARVKAMDDQLKETLEKLVNRI